MKGVVLIVDDDELLIAVVARGLVRLGLTVLIAHDGTAALELVRQHDVDVVISDENMPNMSGLALLATLADRHPDVVRVMMTGSGKQGTVVGAINRARVFRYLTKPVSATHVASIIEEALAHRERARVTASLMRLAGEQFNLMQQLRGAAASDAGPVPVEAKLPSSGPLAALTPAEITAITNREEQVLRLLAQGNRVRAVAAQLEISPHTVRNHLRSLFEKLGVHSQQELLSRLVGSPDRA